MLKKTVWCVLGVLLTSLGTLENDNSTRYILDLSLPKRPDGKYAIAKVEVTFDPGDGTRASPIPERSAALCTLRPTRKPTSAGLIARKRFNAQRKRT